MSHEHESSLSVGKQAWHGLAKVLDRAPTIEEAPDLSGLNWDVAKEPLYVGGGTLVKGWSAIRRLDKFADDGGILGVVTDDYCPVQNRRMFEWFRGITALGMGSIETAGSLKGGRVVWCMARLNTGDELPQVVPDDTVIPFLLFGMGHDGRMRVHVRFTPIRVVCWNTLSAAVEGRGNVIAEIRHIGNGEQIEAQLGAAQRVTEAALEAFTNQIRVFRAMSMVPLSVDKLAQIARETLDGDYIRAMAHLTKLKAKNRPGLQEQIDELQKAINELGVAKSVDRVIDAYRVAPGADMAGETVWGGLNAITHVIDRTEKGEITEARFGVSHFGAGALQRQRAFDALLAQV